MGIGKTALVTGASAGIGKAFAEQLAKDGFDLVITARRKQRLEQLASELRSDRSVRVTVIAEDLADPKAPERMFAELARQNIRIDLLVNNAGYGISGTFASTSYGTYADFLQVMVTSVVHLTHLFLPGMIERGYGRIIQVSSLAAFLPGAPTSTLYAASKAFLVKFSESLASEVAGKGVHVTAVCPGFTYSEFHDVMGIRSVVSRLPSVLFQPADRVAREAIDAAMSGEVVVVTGPLNRALKRLMRHLPEDAARQLVYSRAKHFRRVPGSDRSNE